MHSKVKANKSKHLSVQLLTPTPIPFLVGCSTEIQLEDLTVLKRSPDLLNNVKIGQDQLQLTM